MISAEVILATALAVFFTAFSRVDENTIIWDVFATVCWFSGAMIWVSTATFGGFAYFLMGGGIMMAVFTVMDSIEFMRIGAEEANDVGSELR